MGCEEASGRGDGTLFIAPTDRLGMASDDRHAQADRAHGLAVVCSVQGDQLAGGFVEAGLEALDFAEPAVEIGFGDAVAQVRDDLDQAWAGAGVDAEAGAADAGLTEMILQWLSEHREPVR